MYVHRRTNSLEAFRAALCNWILPLVDYVWTCLTVPVLLCTSFSHFFDVEMRVDTKPHSHARHMSHRIATDSHPPTQRIHAWLILDIGAWDLACHSVAMTALSTLFRFVLEMEGSKWVAKADVSKSLEILKNSRFPESMLMQSFCFCMSTWVLHFWCHHD